MGKLLILFIILFARQARAVTLLAVDDSFGIPFGKSLQVEAPGVLENDTLDGEAAGENGATVELLSGVANGTLSCPTDVMVALCADGSFDYLPDPSFSGTDSFTYQAVIGSVISAPATVNLTACTGGPLVYACWQESSYLAKLAEFGFGALREGFEGVEWDVARSPVTVASVTSMNITWTSNHPGSNNITTGSGPARTGAWGVYSLPHGVASGTPAQCDIDNPPEYCLFHDGFSGKRIAGESALHGVGAYITGSAGANISIFHGATQTVFGALPDPGHHFFAVIDASAAGFAGFKFQEMDGKVGQQLLIFGDDFVFATSADIDDGQFFPLNPCRIFDTRVSGSMITADTSESFYVWEHAAGDILSQGGTGDCGVPATAKAVVINLTAAQSVDKGHFRIYPYNGTLPTASILNFNVSVNMANATVAPICQPACLFDISIYSFVNSHAIGDVMGYFE